jgi:phytoene dehydrogenase-like protein
VTQSPSLLSRRELFAILLGAQAATWVGCSRSTLPFSGELLSPDFSIGHRIRDGFRPEVKAQNVQPTAAVIVGGGIAGLTAAWRLRRAGLNDFVLLEIDAVPGGTSRSGKLGEFTFPWGAHYVPTPMKEHSALITLFKEMGVIVGEQDNGEPQVAEQFLCREPEERVFVEGQWIEGLYPAAGASDEDLQQLEAFRLAIDNWIERRDQSGKRMFAIPVATASDCDEVRALDKLSMSDWLIAQGFTSPRLRWLVDYSCRDDYGLTVEQTSAWAGIFYFASRNKRSSDRSQDVITWPEGNGRLVDYLVACVADSIRCSHAVCEIRAVPSTETITPAVTAWDAKTNQATGFEAKHVVFAAPQFVAPYVIRDFRSLTDREPKRFQYGSWLVANIHLRDRPSESGMPMSWDNVIYESQSLGYVTSTHQTGIDFGATVLTWYYPLTHDEGKISRQQLLSLTWTDWAEVVIADLQQAHPDIVNHIMRLDIMRWGHAMIQPRPGFVWSDARRNASRPFGKVHFANTDLSGVALMEEAFYHGVRAAEEVLAALGHDYQSMLSRV